LDLLGRRTPSPREVDDRETTRREIHREAKMFGWLAAFLVVVLLFGFLIATPALLFAYLRFAERESAVVSLVAAAVGLAVVYGMFVELLGLTVFEGLLIEAFVS
jgi:hypothetical protein